jgi:hypothetical protein
MDLWNEQLFLTVKGGKEVSVGGRKSETNH